MLFALAVGVLCYATWWLGEWQFSRLEDRKDSNAVIRANEDLAPMPVDDVLSPGRHGIRGRRVAAGHGHRDVRHR